MPGQAGRSAEAPSMIWILAYRAGRSEKPVLTFWPMLSFCLRIGFTRKPVPTFRPMRQANIRLSLPGRMAASVMPRISKKMLSAAQRP